MSGIDERRNQPKFWAGEVRWVKLRRKQLPPCDDCVVIAYDWSMRGYATAGEGAEHGRPDVAKAKWRRTVEKAGLGVYVDADTVLCDAHQKTWASWTPGQLSLGSL